MSKFESKRNQSDQSKRERSDNFRGRGQGGNRGRGRSEYRQGQQSFHGRGQNRNFERDKEFFINVRNSFCLEKFLNQVSKGLKLEISTNYHEINNVKICTSIAKMNVKIIFDGQDLAKTEKTSLNRSLIDLLFSNISTAKYVYDNKSCLYLLPIGGQSINDFNEMIIFKGKNYNVLIALEKVITKSSTNVEFISALDVISSNYFNKQVKDNFPITINRGGSYYSKSSESRSAHIPFIFRDGIRFRIKSFENRYYFIQDICVNCFFDDSKSLLQLITGYFRKEPNQIPKGKLEEFLTKFKNIKLKLSHLKIKKKFRSIGPTINEERSRFDFNGKSVTVEEYFKIKSKEDTRYQEKLNKYLPTINCGTEDNKVLIPIEFICIPFGEFLKIQDKEISSKLIKQAVIKPSERLKFLKNNHYLNSIRNDEMTKSFGLNEINSNPLRVEAHVIPPPTIKYKNTTTCGNGEWRIPDRSNFFYSANKEHIFEIFVDFNHENEQMEKFKKIIAETCRNYGLQIIFNKSVNKLSDWNIFGKKIDQLKRKSYHAMMIIENPENYNMFKTIAHQKNVISQAVLRPVFEKINRSISTNLSLKINTKLGGINHLVDLDKVLKFKRSMYIGIDVSHPESGSQNEPSIAAVVGSYDENACKYKALLSVQSSGEEIVQELEAMMGELLEKYRFNNSQRLPDHIIVFRDGVSEGQFNIVREREVEAIKNSIIYLGYTDIKLTFVVCTKRHNTRFFNQEDNLCPGVVIDQTIISRSEIHEFFVNSHLSILGTSRSCKYTCLYDDSQINLSELELITYWITYQYCKCNKSVSYPPPAYYAHWASKSGKTLLKGGMGHEEIRESSKIINHMFFS